MNALLLNILLALVWMMAVGRFTFHQLLLGFLLGFLVVSVVEPLWGGGTYDIVTPELHARPHIFAVPLDARTDTEITLVANFLSLTPGTLLLDVSTDQRTLYVHTMYTENRERFITEVKQGLEARLLEVLR